MPDDEAIFQMSQRLDQDNEHLRMRLLEMTAWMEGAVTDQVACERRLADVEDHASALQAELDAIYQTMTWRCPRSWPTALWTHSPREAHVVTTSVPAFLTVRDRLTSLVDLVGWLERAGFDEIWLVDNDSTYPPMLDYLANTRHHVVRTGRNYGHRSPWLSGAVQRHAHGRNFIVSDPDVIPDSGCPDRLCVLLRVAPGGIPRSTRSASACESTTCRTTTRWHRRFGPGSNVSGRTRSSRACSEPRSTPPLRSTEHSIVVIRTRARYVPGIPTSLVTLPGTPTPKISATKIVGIGNMRTGQLPTGIATSSRGGSNDGCRRTFARPTTPADQTPIG